MTVTVVCARAGMGVVAVGAGGGGTGGTGGSSGRRGGCVAGGLPSSLGLEPVGYCFHLLLLLRAVPVDLIFNEVGFPQGWRRAEITRGGEGDGRKRQQTHTLTAAGAGQHGLRRVAKPVVEEGGGKGSALPRSYCSSFRRPLSAALAQKQSRPTRCPVISVILLHSFGLLLGFAIKRFFWVMVFFLFPLYISLR